MRQFPRGKLICTRNGVYTKWYHRYKSKLSYIPKKKKQLAEQLAVKKYLTLRLEEVQKEKRLLQSYLKQHTFEADRKDYKLLMDPKYQELLKSYYQNETACSWQNESYCSNPNYLEQLNIKAYSGIYVRSKSEALIDMLLCVHRIPHRYECELKLKGIYFYPDFTLLHPQTGEIYYWEHFGLMDDPLYCKRMANKLEKYAVNGIIPTINLITTYETAECPLSPEKVEEVIENYFGYIKRDRVGFVQNHG